MDTKTLLKYRRTVNRTRRTLWKRLSNRIVPDDPVEFEKYRSAFERKIVELGY